MGKGLRAKFYAFSFLSYVRGTLHTLLEESTSPAALMVELNKMLLDDEVLEDTFATFLLIHWDPTAHTLTYANAGHCRPVLVSPDGAEVPDHSDLILGLEKDVEFSEVTVDLSSGTALVAYTDGLTEQHTLEGDMLGEDGVRDLVSEAYDSDERVQGLLDGTLARSASDQFEDDLLVVWLQRDDDSS
jgi:serine phosphatase RsbU (regulator of sigma subunit)